MIKDFEQVHKKFDKPNQFTSLRNNEAITKLTVDTTKDLEIFWWRAITCLFYFDHIIFVHGKLYEVVLPCNELKFKFYILIIIIKI